MKLFGKSSKSSPTNAKDEQQVEGDLECTSYKSMNDSNNDSNNAENSSKQQAEQEEVNQSQSQESKLPPPAAFQPMPSESKSNDEEEEVKETNQESSKGSKLVHMVSSVLPFEKLPWITFFCLSTWCAIPAIVYILLFTQLGFGESFYYALSNTFGGYAYMLAGVLAISGFLFWIFDIDEWNSAVGNMVRLITMAAMFAVFVLLVILVSNEMPFGIITLYSIINPLWLLAVKSVFYRKRDTRTFVSWLSGPLFFVSILTAISFIVWVCMDYSNEWNSVTKVEAAERTGCEANFEDYPNCVAADGSGNTCFYVDYSNGRQELAFPEGCDNTCLNVYSKCANGFILWAGPVLMSLSMMFLSFFCTFLRIDGKASDKEIFNFGKMWFFILFLLWASASLSGTAAGVTSSLSSLTLASMAGAAILLAAIFSKEEIDSNHEAVLAKIQEKYGDNLDVVRGLFVVTCSPIVVAYFFISAINQLVRRLRLNPCSQPASDSGSNAGILTVTAKKQLTRMRAWDRAKVFTYAVYWGVAYMIMQVIVAQLTVVFLSWMIESTSGLGLGAVTGILAAVGVFMFLLPPVPGVPVYLTLGIVLAATGHEILGWTGSILYSTGVALVLKLFSSALQQKLIGENLSHYVSVRQFVGINSTLMKGMKLVLKPNGISIPKVAILIGGPDWPTSVLCGIMRLPLLQIMLGTLPIVFLIFPTCLTGALLYMTSLETDTGNPVFPWAGTVSTLTASSTAMVQFGSMMVAAYYLEQAADKRVDEVNAIQDDKEVKEADERDEHLKKCYGNVTTWNAVPTWPKLILVSSLISITASCYMVQFFSHLCFAEHSLTDSFYVNLNGKLANLFLPLGWVALGLFGASMVLLSVFTTWGKREANKLAESGKMVPLSQSNSSEIA